MESVGTRARLLATGTRGSSSRGHLTPVSVLLCLCPRRLASKTHVVSGLADSEHPFNRECRFSPAHRKRIISRCFQHGVKPAEKYWFLPHYTGGPPVLGENEKRIQCSMHVLHSSGVPHRWYCISFIKNVCDMIYKTRSEIIGLGLLDCVGQPYHLPSDLIVTLLTELAQLENERFQPEEALNLFYSRTKSPSNESRFVCVCVFFACACAPTSLFSLSAAVQCLPLRGRLCLRWPTLHECKC